MSGDPQQPESEAATDARGWLISRAGVTYPLNEGSTRIGRGKDNDVVIGGLDAPSVSVHHCEIIISGDAFGVRDLDSTNGTFVNGERVTEAELAAPATIRLGSQGPEFSFVRERPDTQLNKTLWIPDTGAVPAGGTYDGMLSDAVEQARRARSAGLANETMSIMRDVLQQALHRTKSRARRIITVLAAVLVAVSSLAGWKIHGLNREKRVIDQRIQEIEAQLNAAGADADVDRLITELDTYQGEAQQIQRSLLYRIASGKEDLVTREIRILMAEFGAEVYSVPTEFAERVKYHLEQYQGPNRAIMAHAFGRGERNLRTIRKILGEEQLPADLAYIPVVETALDHSQSSTAGAAGPWQFTAGTARAYGLRVDGKIDERHDLQKATRAGCRYLRELILDFGAGSSMMLALAAYNSGPTKVKQAVMKTVSDPIKQRNFWYLYRRRALPPETREYVPKVVAVMIIGRNPERFGFGMPSGDAQ